MDSPNNISISNAETEIGNELDKDNDKNEESDEESEIPTKQKRAEKFVARKHGKEREPCMAAKTYAFSF